MDNKFAYREILPGEEVEVCKLIIDCFTEFIAPGYSQEGIDEFKKYANSNSLANRIETTDNFAVLAFDGLRVIGIVEVRSHNHVSLLFVNKEYHKKGVAKRLLKHAIEKCKLFYSELNTIDVNSSPYAVEIYTKMGFVKTDNEQVKNGIRFTPMILRLEESDVEISEKINFITGGLELLPMVKPLWEGLREYHSKISKDFSESIRKRSFEDRVADFEGKANNHIFRIELLKVNGIQAPIGYSISSLSKEFAGELESIFIEETYQRAHFGDVLMKNALKWMDEHNAKSKRISVMAGNEVLKFYEKYGFKVRSHVLEQVD